MRPLTPVPKPLEANMNIDKLSLAILLLFILAGCSENSNNKSREGTHLNAPPNDHIWKPQTRALEKAKEVENIIMDSAKQRREQIEQQEK